MPDRDTIYRTRIIEEEYKKAAVAAKEILHKAKVRCQTLTKVDHIVESQQAYIKKLDKMFDAILAIQQEPLA